MPYTVVITLDPYTKSLVGLNKEAWDSLIKSVHGGTLLNLGGFAVRLGEETKSVRDVLATKFSEVRDIDLSFIELLNNSGKLILASFGSMITMVNSVNGILNSRVGSAILVNSELPTGVPSDDKTPFRFRGKEILVGAKPENGVKRGQAIFDPAVLESLYLKTSKHVRYLNLKELRFGVRFVKGEMFVEFTYEGKYGCSFVGSLGANSPVSILAMAIVGFDKYVGGLTSKPSASSGGPSKGKQGPPLAQPSSM